MYKIIHKEDRKDLKSKYKYEIYLTRKSEVDGENLMYLREVENHWLIMVLADTLETRDKTLKIKKVG